MRAGRLLNLLLLLQNGDRMKAAELARRLEVSERTVLRDLEVLSGSGVPVFGTRGPNGGFEMLTTFDHPVPLIAAGLSSGRGRLRRIRVRLSPAALQRAIAIGKPEAWRVRPNAHADTEHPDWIEGSFRFDSYEAAVGELLALGVDVEVLLPVEMRNTMAEVGRRILAIYAAEAPVLEVSRSQFTGSIEERPR